MSAARHSVTESDVIDMPDDMLTYSEALAIARRKADLGLAVHPGMMVTACGVSLEGYKWTWWYKLGWKRLPFAGKDD